MLDWYASLLALRRKYVINAERTSRVKLLDGVIHLQVPREEPVLKVFARVLSSGTRTSAELPSLGAGWEKVLAEEADGYAVSIWVETPDVR
jgi:hypothetical protein